MTPVVPPQETDERRPAVAQAGPAVEASAAPAAAAGASSPEAAPSGVPSAAPPAPPGRSATAQTRQLSPGRRWALGMGLAVLGGFAWCLYCLAWYSYGFDGVDHVDAIEGRGILALLLAILAVAAPAAPCLAAGWLLRSWRGLLAAAGMYVAVAALLWALAAGGGPAGAALGSVEFALYVVWPAVLNSAIGTVFGMYLARHAEQ